MEEHGREMELKMVRGAGVRVPACTLERRCSQPDRVVGRCTPRTTAGSGNCQVKAVSGSPSDGARSVPYASRLQRAACARGRGLVSAQPSTHDCQTGGRPGGGDATHARRRVVARPSATQPSAPRSCVPPPIAYVRSACSVHHHQSESLKGLTFSDSKSSQL